MADERELQWDKIRIDFEAGSLSNREIGRKWGCSEGMIRKQAKAERWTKDLTQQIAVSVRSQMVRSPVRTPQSEAAEREIVDRAATEIVEIAQNQRDLIAKLEAILRELLEALNFAPDEKLIRAYLYDMLGQEPTKKEIKAELRLTTLTTEKKAAILKSLGETAERLIRLQRQAYNMDAVPKDPTSILSEVMDVIAARNTRCLPGSIDEL